MFDFQKRAEEALVELTDSELDQVTGGKAKQHDQSKHNGHMNHGKHNGHSNHGKHNGHSNHGKHNGHSKHN